MMESIIKGKGVVDNIALGKLIIIKDNIEEHIKDYSKGDIKEESEKFEVSLEKVRKTLEEIVDKFYQDGKKEQSEIMEAHLAIVNDPELKRQSMELITDGYAAPEAILQSSVKVAKIFEDMEDAYLRERASDIKDVGKRIAKEIMGIKDDLLDLEDDIILYGDEIEPSVLANIPDDKVKGIILGTGSTTSHTVIIAKSKEIPTIVGVKKQKNDLEENNVVIINGYDGTIIINPNVDTIEIYKKKICEEEEKKKYYLELTDVPSVTIDGKNVLLAANIGNEKDIDDALKYGCEGVGLFRTEFVYMRKDSLPTEEEQYEAYKYAIENCKEKLCIIRTMDIGGDKKMKSIEIEEEENPFLGWRAIRISLELSDIFSTQIRAILRASAHGKVGIMLPMIISMDELIQAKKIIENSKEELKNEGLNYSEDIQVGIMIETPAAVIMSNDLAKECDFFSIGTNDLVQYTLAVDRGNAKVSNLYDPFNPAVIRSIFNVIKVAHDNNIWVGMCGEAASNPLAAILFVSMGIDELSMSGPSIPKVKEVIRKISIDKELVEQIMSINSKSKIKEVLENYKSKIV